MSFTLLFVDFFVFCSVSLNSWSFSTIWQTRKTFASDKCALFSEMLSSRPLIDRENTQQIHRWIKIPRQDIPARKHLTQAPPSRLLSQLIHLQAVTIVDSRWDLILLPYRLVFLLLLFSRMGPFCHLIEAHGLGCETAHGGIRRQAAEFPQPLTVPHSIRMHRILTFHNLWVSRLI